MFTRVARSKDLLDSADPLHHHVPCVIVGNKLDLSHKQVQPHAAFHLSVIASHFTGNN